MIERIATECIADRTASPNERQPLLLESLDSEKGPTGPLIVAKRRYATAFRSEWRRTDRGLLVYPGEGVVTLHTRIGSWVLTCAGACWLPACEEYQIETAGQLELYEVCCPGLPKLLPNRCGLVPISKLLRELILAFEAAPSGCAPRTPIEHMVMVVAGQLAFQDVPPLRPPTLSSPRLLTIARSLISDPANSQTLAEWAGMLRTTTRTLARAFQREARMTFTEFRQQVRLHAALERLGAGHSVTSVAYDLGFASAASFIATFREATGVTPAKYFRLKAERSSRK